MYIESIDKFKIFSEFDYESQKFWFNLKRDKFLHSIDTFYYSCYFDDDFTSNTQSQSVIDFRNCIFEDIGNSFEAFTPSWLPSYLVLKRSSFAGFYCYCISKPDFYDIFIAPIVPTSSTPPIIVQLRSYFLWINGSRLAFDKSFNDLVDIFSFFGFNISDIKENRCDYCWHTNYIQNPSSFLSPDSISKMKVSTFKEGDIHLEFVNSYDYEIDYFRFGRLKSNNCIFRIYLKSKEVVECGYKAFFFKIWLLHGLINRYDMFCLEECYKRRNWSYIDKARLSFYLEFGSSEVIKDKINLLLSSDSSFDLIRSLADELTPPVTLVLNFEYQTMRKFSSSIKLVPFKPHSGVCSRVYNYFDNHKLIIDYLTHNVFRLVRYSEDKNKSRCSYTAFWSRLRNTRLVDCYINVHNLKLIREYSKKLDFDVVRRRTLNSIVVHGIYKNGFVDNYSPVSDFEDLFCSLNDNDIFYLTNYHDNKLRLLASKL